MIVKKTQKNVPASSMLDRWSFFWHHSTGYIVTCGARRPPHLLLQLRRFTRQTTQKVALCVTQRRQCEWQLWIIHSQAALAKDGSCEIIRIGGKVWGVQGVFVCTVYSSFDMACFWPKLSRDAAAHAAFRLFSYSETMLLKINCLPRIQNTILNV